MRRLVFADIVKHKKTVANVANIVGFAKNKGAVNVELIEVHIEVHKLLVRNSFSTN